MANWNELDGWDAAGGTGEIVKPYIKSAADAINDLVAAARNMVNEQRSLAVASHQMAQAWDKVTTSLRYELTTVQQQVGNQMLLDRIATTKSALDSIDWLRDFQGVAGSASNNLAAMAKNLGATIAAAEVLAEIADPNATAYEVGSTGIGALAGVLVGAMIATTAPVWVAISAGIIASMAAKYLWENGIAPGLDIPMEGGELFWDNFYSHFLPVDVNTSYRTAAATRAPVRRDPLAIDLDGDGIETVGVTAAPVLFDHNADGIKTGTGWVAGDDGWLALDIDGNGLIDSGRELFGADTVLSGTPGVDAVYATTGFEALKALDSNGDNVFNAADTAFGQVRIWQDVNQDGVSQYNELFTLAQKNIASINLNASTTTQNLGNGNVVSGTATVTRTNGTTTLAETVGVAADTTAANLELGSNPFYRDFTDTVVLTTQAQGLPDMHGSGWDLPIRTHYKIDSCSRNVREGCRHKRLVNAYGVRPMSKRGGGELLGPFDLRCRGRVVGV